MESSQIDLLAAFIPRDRREAIGLGKELPERAFGAMLFADVSGFTKIANDLVERHGAREAAQRLTALLNTTFTVLTDVIHRYGGEVIGFAGDGISCWFEGEQAGVLATAAALEGRQSFADRDAGPDIKVVVTAGYVHRFLLGKSGHQRFDVLAGAIVDRMAAAETLASAGEVMVGAEVLGWLGDRIQVLEWRKANGSSQLAPSESFGVLGDPVLSLAEPIEQTTIQPLDPEAVRDWVPSEIFERIARGEPEFVSEYRHVVTLFLKFGGLDYETDAKAGEGLESVVEWVLDVVGRYGGYVFQLVVGDKGSYFCVSFGAPSSHEDDIMRALRAATELAVAPTELEFLQDLQVGVSTGVMLCGAYGGPARRSYSVIGSAANEAARLMEAAEPGQILVAPAVAKAAGSQFHFKEVDEAIPAMRMIGPGTLPSADLELSGALLPLVGRRDELNYLVDWLRATSTRQTLTALVGEAGIGKSRLLAEVVAGSADLGYTPQVLTANSIDEGTPFHSWRGVFANLIESPDALRQWVESHPEFTDLAPLLNPVISKPFDETELTAHLERESRSGLAIDMMVAFLEERLAQPALLILDDAQWLDSASRTLLAAIRDRLPSIRVLVATRPGRDLERSASSEEPRGEVDQTKVSGIPLRVQALLRPDDKVVDLGPLEEPEVEQLVELRLGVKTIPHDLSTIITTRAGGSPFFAEELIETFIQQGLIALESGRVVLKESLDSLRQELPESVARQAESRLSDLTGAEQTTLKVASLLGAEFAFEMLRDVDPAPIDEEELLRQLGKFEELGILTRRIEGRSELWRFRHNLLQEAARALPTVEASRNIHGAAARWLEGHTPRPGPALLAHHWDRAGEWKTAARYLEEAGTLSLGSSAYDEAAAEFRRALTLWREHEEVAGQIDAARWHMLLGEALVFQQGEDERQAREDLEEGLRLIGLEAPRLLPAQLSVVLEATRQAKHRVFGPSPVKDEARRERLLLAARAYEQLVEVYFLAEKDMHSLHASISTLNLAEKAGGSAEMARGSATMGVLFGFMPWRRVANWYLERAQRQAVEAEDPKVELWVALVSSFYRAGLGEWQEAGSWARRGRELADMQRNRRRHIDAISHLMVQAYFQGHLSEALNLADELQNAATLSRAKRSLAYSLQGRAYSLVDMGRLDEAEEAIRELQEMGYDVRTDQPLRPDDEATASDTLGLHALVQARRGDIASAVDSARLLVHRMKSRRPFNFSAFMAYTAAAEVLFAASRLGVDDDQLRRDSRESLSLLERYTRIFPIGRPRLLLWQGAEEQLNNRLDRARRRFQLSAELAASLGMTADEARARQELRRLDDSDGLENSDELGLKGAMWAHTI